MSEPWFNPQQFGTYFGAIGGGVGGSLIGILGGLTGTLAPRGKGKPIIVALWLLFSLAGDASLVFGALALATGQPYGIWFPLLLVGAIIGTLCPALLFRVVLPAYRQAEARKLAAEEIRGGSEVGPMIEPR